MLLQRLGLLHQVVDVDLVPQRGVPAGKGVDDGGDDVPEPLEVRQVLAGLAKCHVVGDDELEQVLLLVEILGLDHHVVEGAVNVLAVLLAVVEVIERRVRRFDGVGADLTLDGERREFLEEFSKVFNLLGKGVGRFPYFPRLELLHHAELLLDVERLLLQRGPRQGRLFELLQNVLADGDAVRFK